MSARAFHADSFVLAEGMRGAGWLLVEDGRFGGWFPEEEASAGSCAGTVVLAGVEVEAVELGDALVAPGYVDTHIHGFLGHDVMDADAEGLAAISAGLARVGTTSWLPTTLTAPFERIEAACASVALACSVSAADQHGRARIQGIHVEGPFFTAEHAGAQDVRYLVDPDLGAVDSWNRASGGLVRKLSLAPERNGANGLIRRLVQEGIVCALGHTSASFAQAAEAIASGASMFTHTFNGMADLGHREPGTVGAAFTVDGTCCELICDGYHVDPVACDALMRARGWRSIALVTDCLSCGGLEEGEYVLGELPIVLSGGVAHLKEKGNIAGSILTMAQAVRNVVSWGIATIEEAVRMASEVPADSAGIGDACGRIAPGRDADFNVLDSDCSVRATYVGGVAVR
ncbi:MAG: N-acetylglucosamine-6-phosphate deacetylase [Atopobiaceae bacterium]|nr:N-acetylglucosamine-6-phosphate deacetylase [Atopobiaceae bacterium]